MNSLDSSSLESTMDTATAYKNNRSSKLKRQRPHLIDTVSDCEEEGDSQVWETLDRNFRHVQSVLDRNRVLIQQVNENHQSKTPDNMVKNVALIQELNGNISKVVSLYSDLNANFSTAFHQHSKNGTANGK
ncbi:protein EARLY FLOWERING 4 [Carica papaya]|uniref:protein EARLY FLOWERING 4 n=1 Tax=Carica papaya TaxID=3649 RepID=UPI000B8CCA76|nr:protein EARLY FLOWERING 4 [Carica papaya]